MAWLRSVGGVRELVIASDSRLSGGQFWDANPKIMLLPRSDAVLSFAGTTSDAYPLMLQAYNSIRMYPPASSRAVILPGNKGLQK
jgi:ATP-dependent protease HslVU (ClpYQ) peptidase subunit